MLAPRALVCPRAAARRSSSASVSFGRALCACLLLAAAGLGRPALADDAAVDPSFDVGAGFDADVEALALQPDGKIVVAGEFTAFDGVARNRIARLRADGSLDPAFVGPVFSAGAFYALAIQPDGKVLVGGTSQVSNADRGPFRLNPDGTRDTAFNAGGSGIIGTVEAIVVQPDGKILVGGNFDTFNGAYWHNIVRLHPDGSIDTSFAIGAGFDAAVFALALQPDGKILAGGRFIWFNGRRINHVARLLPDGTRDPSFVPGPGIDGGFDNDVYSLALQPDGKLVVGGQFTGFDSGMPQTRNFIARLEASGALDFSFDPDRGFNNGVSALALQPNGRIFAGGGFTSFIHGDNTSTPVGFLARLRTDGSLGQFDAAPGFDSSVRALAMQPDGALVVGGRFTTYDGVARGHLVRLRGYTGNVFPVTVNGVVVDEPHEASLTVTNPVDISFTLDGVPTSAEMFAVLDAPAVRIARSFLTAAGTWLPLQLPDWNAITPWLVRAPGSARTTFYRGTLPPGTYDLILGFDTGLDGHYSFAAAGVTTFYRRLTITVQ